MEWVTQSPGNKLYKSARMTVQYPLSHTHTMAGKGFDGWLLGIGDWDGAREEGAGRRGWILLFLDPGTGACGIAFDQSLKNCTGGEPDRVGEKQNRLCPRRKRSPFQRPASHRLQHLERGDMLARSSSCSHFCFQFLQWALLSPSPGLHPSSLLQEGNLDSDLSARCYSPCMPVSSKPLYF